MTTPWYKKAYSRNVLDMHINDWNPRFLAEFDPASYVKKLTDAKVQSTVLYAHSHVGLTNYPTRYGQMHHGLKDRNIFGETAKLCHQNGIAVQLYFSLIFDTWAYRNHSSWRMIAANGKGVADTDRYGVCCPNSPYREYVLNMIDEFCETQEFDGVRFDMTFWPTVCYCEHCRKRFRNEVGEELPVIVNWENPVWVAFQRKREDWLTEFAKVTTDQVQRHRPDASVEHQASTLTLFWRFGVTWEMTQHNTFLQGDFYGNILQGSVARKVFHNLSNNLPIGFETSFCVNLNNHTARKSSDWLRCKACAAVADGASFVFIDAVDPEGTFNTKVYDTMGNIFAETDRYVPYLGGERCQDIGIYFSTESKYDPADNGTNLAGSQSKGSTNQEPSTQSPHVEAMFAAAGALIRHHVPFGILTKKNLPDLAGFKVIVLPDVLMMDEEEIAALREYVANGGCLYASKNTSLQKTDGSRTGNFMLSDVLGIKYTGETEETFTYIAPTQKHAGLFEEYNQHYPLGFEEKQVRLEMAGQGEVWANLTLPYSNPSDWENFTSIHSNPPGPVSPFPAIVRNVFGQGQTIYCSAALERYRPFDKIFVNLVQTLCPEPSFRAEAPPVVEVIMFWQPERKRHLVSVLNFQEEQPNIPVNGVRVRIKKNHRIVKSVFEVPSQTPLGFSIEDDYTVIEVPTVDVLVMLLIDYQ